MPQHHPSEHRFPVKAEALCFWNGAGRKTKRRKTRLIIFILKKEIKIIGNEKENSSGPECETHPLLKMSHQDP